MSGQPLIRLPPCIRQTLLGHPRLPLRSIPISLRSFSNSKSLLKGRGNVKAAPKAHRQHRSPAPSRPPSTAQSSPQTARQQPPPRARGSTPTYISLEHQLAATDVPILIYKAPNHAGFRIFCLVAAVIFGGWGLNWTNMVWKRWTEKLLNTWVFGATMFVTIMTMVFATTFLLAPLKMVHSIQIVPGGSKLLGPMLRMEKDGLGALRGRRYFEAHSKTCAMDVQFSSTPHVYRNLALPGTVDTEAVAENTARTRTRGFSPWDIFYSWVQKMFTRNGIAYLRVPGHGNWKLDLERCQMMDHGRIVDRLLVFDPQIRRNMWQILTKS